MDSNFPDASKAGQAFDCNPQNRLRRFEERDLSRFLTDFLAVAAAHKKICKTR